MDQITNWPEGASSFGVPLIGSGYIPVTGGRYIFVNPYSGNDGNSGLSFNSALETIGAAVAMAKALDVLCIMPGSYNEQIVIPRSVGALTIVGLGNQGDVGIDATGLDRDPTALNFHNDDLTLINIDIEGDIESSNAAIGDGSRFRAYNCKFEGATDGGSALSIGPGSVAAIGAGTAGRSGDTKLYNCEFAFSAIGLSLVASDFGVPTQVYISNPLFQNISNTEILGVPGAFGIGSVRNIECLFGCFDNMEDGTKPADYINVAGALDTGIFRGNAFALATNAAADLKIGAGIKWVTNYTEAGSSTARPA